MSITDELREYANKAIHRKDYMLGLSHDLMRIADRIDAAHKHGIGYVDDRDPETMAEYGWVKLPKDRDGVTWTGEERVFEEANGCRHAMYGLMHDGERWFVDCGLVGPDKHHHLIETTLVRHAEPDTWERIIEDARTCTGSAGNYTAVPSMRWTSEVDALVARCRALAGENE
jgi:hypothetical protein